MLTKIYVKICHYYAHNAEFLSVGSMYITRNYYLTPIRTIKFVSGLVPLNQRAATHSHFHTKISLVALLTSPSNSLTLTSPEVRHTTLQMCSPARILDCINRGIRLTVRRIHQECWWYMLWQYREPPLMFRYILRSNNESISYVLRSSLAGISFILVTGIKLELGHGYRNWYQDWGHYCVTNDLGSSPQPEGEARGLWWASQVVGDATMTEIEVSISILSWWNKINYK